MNGYEVLLWLRRQLPEFALSEEGIRDVDAALSAKRLEVLDFCLWAGFDAKLDEAETRVRSAAMFCNYIAGNLSDDLSDGDCDYLEQPERTGPAAQFVLQNLCYALLARSTVGNSVIARVSALLVRAGGAQHFELRTEKWTLERSQEAAKRFGGDQYAAYLSALWAGTSLERTALEWGTSLGIYGYVALDCASRDLRVTTLSVAERETYLAWATEQRNRVAGLGIRSFDMLIRAADTLLARTADTPLAGKGGGTQ